MRCRGCCRFWGSLGLGDMTSDNQVTQDILAAMDTSRYWAQGLSSKIMRCYTV